MLEYLVNRSTPVSASTLNAGITGLDVSRYSADVMGLTVSISRAGLRLVISGYLPSDSITTFQCVGQYSDDSFYYSLTPMNLMDPADPPSSPVVTFSQSDSISCSNVLTWSTPSTDRPITSFFVYRDGTLVYNGTDNQYTDNTQLNVDTVYEYSVVAISCAGNSTAGVNTTSIKSTSLATDPPPNLTHNIATDTLFVVWTLNPSQLITVTYNLSLVYNYTQNDITDHYNGTYTFSQISTNTSYTQSLIRPTLRYNESVTFAATATLNITQQCSTVFPGIELTATTESTFITSALLIGAIIGIVSGVCICCLLILIGVIIVCVLQKKGKGYSTINPKKRSDSQEIEEPKQMEGLYAEMDHTLPKPDTIKRHEPIEETLYTQVHAMDGPNH